MAHVHEPTTVVHEPSHSGSGMGMVLGIILAIVLALGMFWFFAGARMFDNGTTTPQDRNPTINIAPPNIDIDKPSITVNPQNPQPDNSGQGSGGQ